jgi:hypothetical protein
MKKYVLLLLISILSYESISFAGSSGMEKRHDRRKARKDRHTENHS